MAPFAPPPNWGRPKTTVPAQNGFSADMGYQTAQPGANHFPSKERVQANAPQPYPANRLGQAQPLQGQLPQNPANQPMGSTAYNAAPVTDRNSSVESRPSSEPRGDDDFISQKIWKINGKDKVVDFNSKLTKAKLKDFANVHGCGGSGHNPNSTIGVTLCDYTKGTGDKSVTVKYAIDVEDMPLLLEAAKLARLGLLKPNTAPAFGLIDSALKIMVPWQSIPGSQDGTVPIPANELAALDNTLQNARAAAQTAIGNPVFSYVREKNNPYKLTNGLAPVSHLEVVYAPYRGDGQVSRYPWYLKVENFDAPLKKKSNGATTHDSSQAVNKRSAFINISADDFAAAMVAVDRFVRLWEHRMLPDIEEAYRRIEASRTDRAANNVQPASQESPYTGAM